MARHSRSGDPGIASLASGVVIGGIGLGAAISLAIDTEMKRPAYNARPASELPESTYSILDETWLNAGIGIPGAPGKYGANLDHDEGVGGSLSLEGPISRALSLPVEGAVDAEEAATRQGLATPSAPGRKVQPRKSSLAREGLY